MFYTSRGKYVIKKDPTGEYWFFLYASNGQMIAKSAHGYKTKSGVENGIASVQKHFDAPIEDLTKS